MNIEDVIGPVAVTLFVAALSIEKFAPRERQEPMRGWRTIGWLFFGVSAALNIGLPLLLPILFIATHSLLPGDRLGVAGGFVVGFLAWGCVYYWLHRSMHRFEWLWRMTHQLHHSARRVDVSGFAYTHPLDIATTTVASIILSVGVLGLHPQAAALVGLYGTIAAVVQHTNMSTPRWLEWFMQRPEAHVRHHEYRRHAGNYADWPAWDKLFGTYRAPVAASLRYGFDAAASKRVGAMLLWRDVNREGKHYE